MAATHGADATAGTSAGSRVVVGRITGLYGVRGWVKVFSYTEPRAGILDYGVWQIGRLGEWTPMRLAEGREHGKGVVARLAACEDRETATQLLGAEIAVDRSELPHLPAGEYYWTDLIGLQVVDLHGTELGHVDHLMETGANDVLVVQGDRERLIPFVREQVVVDIDLKARRITVDWDADF